MSILGAVQSTAPADLIINGGVTVTSSYTTGFVWIPIVNVAVTSSNTANPTLGIPSPGVVNAGAALIYNTVTNRLSIFSTGINEWRTLNATFTSS